ncbi:MAG: hypothetical protein ABIG29_01425 [Candidatus Nealsonbacteria bacterium]
MVTIKFVKEGDILITEEWLSGQQHIIYGPVIMIGQATNEIGIKTSEGNRLFPADKLWTIHAFLARKTNSGSARLPPNQETRALAGFIVTLLEGGANLDDLKGISEELKRKGIKPTRTQEAIETLIRI